MLEIVFFHSAIRGEMTFLTEMFINFLDAMENPDDMPVSDEEFQTLRNDFMSFAKVLRAHNAAEDKLLFPVIIARNPAGREPLERLMVDHLHIGANLKELLRLIDLYLTTPHEDGARLALLRNIVTLMGRLRIQMYAHLYREETVLQSLMAGKMSPEEQNMIVGRIMGHRSSELMEIIIRLLYRHLPKAELEVCLEKINKSVSGTYFERWLATLSGQLETRTDNSDDNDGSMWASHSSSKIAPTYSDIEQRHRSKKKRKRKSSTGSDRSNAEARIDSSAMDFADPNASSPALRIPAETLPPEVLPTVGPSAAESSIRTSENMPSSDGGNNADSISRQPSMHSLSSAPSNSSASSNEEEALPDLESEKDRGYHTEEIETHKAVAKLITGASSDFIQRAIAKVRRDFESAPVATIQHIIEMVTGAQKELQRKGLSADAFADGDISSKVDPSSSELVNDKALAAPSPHISTDTAATPSSGTASTDIESTPTSGASPCSGYNESNAESTNAPESIQRHPSDKSLDKSGFVTGSGGISNPLPPSDTASVASSRSTSGSSHRTSRFKASDPIEAVAIPVLSDPVDLEPSYFDADRKILGCKHYRRKCKLIAPCCGRAFVCRLCHDDALQEAHILDRFAVKFVMCMCCKLVQPVAQVCANKECSAVFGRYFCSVCRFFDDGANSIDSGGSICLPIGSAIVPSTCSNSSFGGSSSNSSSSSGSSGSSSSSVSNSEVSVSAAPPHSYYNIYHCPFCNVCRKGDGLGIDSEFYHCMTCNACVKDDGGAPHRCLPKSIERTCPICQTYLFSSVEKLRGLPRCGHVMHLACYNSYISKCRQASMHSNHDDYSGNEGRAPGGSGHRSSSGNSSSSSNGHTTSSSSGNSSDLNSHFGGNGHNPGSNYTGKSKRRIRAACPLCRTPIDVPDK